MSTNGLRLRELFERSTCTLMPGALDMVTARIIKQLGYEAVWASGAMASASRIGWADSNVITLTEMASYVADLVEVSRLPVLADVDNGYGSALNAMRMIWEMAGAGAAGVIMDDQVAVRRFSLAEQHNKPLIPVEEYVGKIRAAIDYRSSPGFPDPNIVIVARTDFAEVDEGLERASAWIDAGADALMPHSIAGGVGPVRSHERAARETEDYVSFANGLKALGYNNFPLIISSTRQHTVSATQMGALGYKIMIQALVAPQVMWKACWEALKVLKEDDGMQTNLVQKELPADLWERFLGYDELRDREEKYLPAMGTQVGSS